MAFNTYRVFDSYQQLASRAQQIWLLPTAGVQSKHSSWLHPLLISIHVLLCALKETPGKKKANSHKRWGTAILICRRVSLRWHDEFLRPCPPS